jgi:chromosomal replication initiation ATPase DnaA|tara:strand:+ start:882 stop:1334 length:453 start_codon:yes stop_codon:yes gene_type:complete
MISMSEHKLQLELLLGNIQEGLKKFTIKELNEAIISFLNKKSDKTTEINYVLDIVCDEYNISKITLKSNNARGVLQDAKQVCYCLLNLNLGLSLRYISDRIFFNNHNSVAIGVRKLKRADKNHKVDKEFIEKYKKLEKRLLTNFANLENN